MKLQRLLIENDNSFKNDKFIRNTIHSVSISYGIEANILSDNKVFFTGSFENIEIVHNEIIELLSYEGIS